MKPVNIRSLTDFKRFLGQQGATLQVMENSWVKNNSAKPSFYEPKTVKKLQTNGVWFSTDAWLAFEKASHYKFEGETVTISISDDGSFKDFMIYKCWIEETI